MTIYIGADHRGFEMKNQVKDWLEEQGYKVVDCGNSQHDPVDDFVDFGRCVAQKMVHDEAPSLGILFCGSGIGMCMIANRFKGVRCGLTVDPEHARHARENDHANAISVPTDRVNFEQAQAIIRAFLTSEPVKKEKYIRRANKMDDL